MALHALQHTLVKGRSHLVDAEGVGLLRAITLHPVQTPRSEEIGNGHSVVPGCAARRQPDGLGTAIQVVRLRAVAAIVPSDDRSSGYQRFDGHEANTAWDGQGA